MGKKSSMKNRLLAGALAMSLAGIGVVSMTDAATSTSPGIYINGFELKIKTDPSSGEKSVQALMEVALAGFTGDNAKYIGVDMSLEYNPDYIEPSDWYTNKTFGDGGIDGMGKTANHTAPQDPSIGVTMMDVNDPLHHYFFRTNEKLCGKTYNNSTATNKYYVDPLNFTTPVSSPATVFDAPNPADTPVNTLSVTPVSHTMRFHAYVRDYNDKLMTGTAGMGQVRGAVASASASQSNSRYYLEGEGTDNRVIFGTISFRVSDKFVDDTLGTTQEGQEGLEANLQKMVEKFNNRVWNESDFAGMSSDSKDFLVREVVSGQQGAAFDRTVYTVKATTNRGKTTYGTNTLKNGYEVEVHLNSDDVINDVKPVKDDVTINSYQAFTSGKISDLATAMQNYAESVRVTRVSGQQGDMVMYWGDPVDSPASPGMPDDGPGMTIQKAKFDGTYWVADDTTPLYRFKWDPASPNYKLEVWDGTAFNPVDETATPVYGVGQLFDPRGGNYIMKQYFTYWENTGDGSGPVELKTFPMPIQVTLHVTPIRMVDVSVERERMTYRNNINEVPPDFAGLRLSSVAKLALDTPLNSVTPTMPVDWAPLPTLSPSWVPHDLNTLAGQAGVGNPNYVSGAPGEVAQWPTDSTAIASKTGVGDYTFTYQVTKDAVEITYPWLTINNNYDVYSYRRIVDLPDTAMPPRYLMWAEPYEDYTSLGSSEIGRLRVTIARQEATPNTTVDDVDWDWDYVNMASGYDIKLYMPNGQQIRLDEVGASATGWFGPETANPDWRRWTGLSGSVFDEWRRGTTHYDPYSGLNNLEFYQFEINPGSLSATDEFASQREVLRRYINLGGWFYAEVTEPGGVPSDTIQAYSKPRTNIHTMSYLLAPSGVTETDCFDYTGNRSGIMPFYVNSVLPKFITLPADEDVEVRYDALTGAQPGKMRQFEVEGWTNVQGNKGHTAPAWSTPIPADNTVNPPTTAVPGEIVTYGADLFKRQRDYSNFGHVTNPAPAPASSYVPQLTDRKATIKVEVTSQREDPRPTPTPGGKEWGLTLTYAKNDNIVSKYSDAQVKRVTFESKLVDYTYEQVVTLILTNKGTKDITGLHIEIPNLGANGPWFKLVTPPPTTLAAGASSTFQISYVENLPVGTYSNVFPSGAGDLVNQPIHIWHDNSGPAHNGAQPETLWDYANNQYHANEGFEAVIQVTKSLPHTVKLVIHPTVDDAGAESKPMGDGRLVEGVTTTAGADSYSDLTASDVYVYGDKFWVVADPKDEYALIDVDDGGTPRAMVYYTLDDGTTVYLNEYKASGSNTGFGTVDDSFTTNASWPNNPRRLFWGEMPDENITVHVCYYEPLTSKLRLSDLHAYAWDEESQAILKSPLEAAAWQDTDPWTYEQPKIIHLGGNSYDVGADPTKGVDFDPQQDEYIVLLKPYDPSNPPIQQNFCGVSIQLRDLVTHINGIDDPTVSNNVDIFPRVMMTIDDASNTIVCNDYPTAANPNWPTTGYPTNADLPTVHHSSLFNAPVDDPSQTNIAQTTVTITLSYDGTGLIPPEGYAERVYKVRFVREMVGEAKHVANPGNSPYGMIMNDSSITNKAAAKAAFDVHNRFDDPVYTPVQARNLLTNIYWPEAWEGGVNYDKDETVLFVYAGESFYDPGVKNIYNNAGDFIDDIMVKRELVDYVELNTGLTSPWDRFSATTTQSVDLGEVPAIKGVIPGANVTVSSTTYNGLITTDFSGVSDIRPGIYKLKYSYDDYDDGVNTPNRLYFTRTLIILSPLGDVDATWQQTGGDTVAGNDVDAIQARFTTPLPYDLPSATYSEAERLLYKFRIADANNDRNINNIDAGMIRRVADLEGTGKLTPFYRATQYTYPVRP